MKIFAQNVVQRCKPTKRSCRHDQKMEPEVNSHDIIRRMLGTNVYVLSDYTRCLN